MPRAPSRTASASAACNARNKSRFRALTGGRASRISVTASCLTRVSIAGSKTRGVQRTANGAVWSGLQLVVGGPGVTHAIVEHGLAVGRHVNAELQRIRRLLARLRAR